jgi:hypothetical protein
MSFWVTAAGRPEPGKVQRTDILADKGAATREPALIAFRSSRPLDPVR